MTSYTNPTGTFAATAGPDSFTFNQLPTAAAAIDAAGGVDSVTIDFGSTITTALSFAANDTFSSGEFDATAQAGVYQPEIWVMNAEVVNDSGGAGNDLFDLKIGPQTANLDVTVL